MTKINLYIIHGWAYSVKNWQETLGLLQAAGVETKMLLVPGLTRPSKKVWNIDDYVQWLSKELQGVSKPIVLAHSNGGRIALNFCYRYPDKIKHLILLNSAGVRPTKLARMRYAVTAFLAKIFRFLKQITWLRRLVHKFLGVSDYYRAPRNMRLTLGNMLSSDKALETRLTAIKTPTSFIWSAQDQATPLKQGLFLKSQLPKTASFEVLEEATHAAYVKSAQPLSQAVIKILKQL